jgi:glyoxylase-like metal-dependent hydrolase (beta-lactamase superfamily II)
VTVCAAGKISQIAAEQLRKAGFEAYSLENGMKGWSLAWNRATVTFDNFQIIQLRRTGKGCLSYIVVSDGKALVIDASLPIQVYQDIMAENEWQLEVVIDTHIHADHLSRSRDLANGSGATLYLPAHSTVQFPFEPVEDGNVIQLGSVTLRVIGTPGHTLENAAFLLDNKVLFSGDTLFTNSIGRPDLKADEAQTKHKTELLYDSLQKLLQLDDAILVLPGHTSSPVNFNNIVVGAKLGSIKKQLSLLQLPKDAFVNIVTAKTPPTPLNYLAIVEHNKTGSINEAQAIELEAGANRCAI